MKISCGKRVFSAVLGIGLLSVPFAGYADFHQENQAEKEAKIIFEILRLIEANSLNPIDLAQCRHAIPEQLSEAAGNANRKPKEQSCLDEFSYYSSPSEVKNDKALQAGRFSSGGIGIFYESRNGEFFITEVEKNSPAERAKILRGDQIIAIRQENETEGFRVGGASRSEIRKKIRGPNGTTVFLTIKRGEDILPVFAIQRADIKIQTTETKEISGGILYIRLKSFSQGSAPDDVKNAVDIFEKTNPSGRIILDLRDNAGGLLFTTKGLLYIFARSKDDILFTLRFRSEELQVRAKDRNEIFIQLDPTTSENSETPSKLPLVVLINSRSASGSEIVAGALQDWSRATIVGETSFGKGVGQTGHQLSDGSMLYLTTFEFLVGNKKRAVHKIGIKPDVEVLWKPKAGQAQSAFLKEYNESFGDPDKDPQLMKAIEILNK